MGDNTTENLSCTLEQRERVVYRSIAVLLYEYIEDNNDVAQTGTVSSPPHGLTYVVSVLKAFLHDSCYT